MMSEFHNLKTTCFKCSVFPGGNSMGVNGGVGVQPPNQQSSLLPDAMLHNSMSAQRYGCFSHVTATGFFWSQTTVMTFTK